MDPQTHLKFIYKNQQMYLLITLLNKIHISSQQSEILKKNLNDVILSTKPFFLKS